MFGYDAQTAHHLRAAGRVSSAYCKNAVSYTHLPVERLIFKVAGINPNEEMNWKQFLKALLILNAFWFVWGDVYKRQVLRGLTIMLRLFSTI